MAFTKEQKKKLRSKKWRMSNLYKIRTKDKGLVTFKRNDAQQHFNENKHSRNIILKSRQLGFTTDETIDGLDDCLTQPNFNMLMISYDKDSAVDIFDEKARLAWENIHPDYKGLFMLDTNRANTLKFDRGNGIHSSFRVRNRGRSGTYNRIHVSEFGKICKESPAKAKEIMAGVIPAVPVDGRIDFESTAEGEEGYFHDLFWEAWLRGEPKYPQQYKAHFYNWRWDKREINKITNIMPVDEMEQASKFKEFKELHDLTDQELTYYYLQWTALNKDWRLLRQEFPTTPEEAFVSRGSKLFDQEIILAMIEASKKHPRKQVDDWWIYEEFKRGHRYALGADVAEGLGLDSSTIVIIDFTPLKPKVVAIYKANDIEPDLFAVEIRRGAVMYGGCLVAVENNNMGRSTLDHLKRIYQEDLIFSMPAMAEKSDEGELEPKTSKKLGWNTNSATKPKMMFDLRTAVSGGLIEIPCRFCLHEMRIFSKDKIKVVRYDEDATNHFDILIALAICWQMKDHVVDQKSYVMTQTGGVNPYDSGLGF